MPAQVDLLASYWTIAVGAEPHTDHEYSSVSFRERVASASRAGFTGIGLWHADIEHTLERSSLKEMRQILDDHGIRHVELEFLNDWCIEGEAKRRSDERKKLLFEAAAGLGARAVKVGDFIRQPCPMPRLIDLFGTLCSDARRVGIKIGFEMMPFCIVDSLDLARALVEGAAAPNAGIFFDLWHIVKIGTSYDELARFPTQYVAGVELNDGLSKAHSLPDLRVETQNRQLLGDGEFDVHGYIATMRGLGWQGPWGIEVLNRALRQLPIDDVTERAFKTTIAQFR
jgi:sugar phosphate isomerase/epimerase